MKNKYHSECKSNEVSNYAACFASFSGVNQVDGLPPVSNNTGAVVVQVPVAPRTFMAFATLKSSRKLHDLRLLVLLRQPSFFQFEVLF